MNTYPYVEARHTSGRQRKPTAILIKPTWTTSETGAALGVAMAQNPSTAPHETAHFTVDETQIFQCVPIKVIAGHSHCSTKNQIFVRLCFDPSLVQYGWESEVHTKLLDNLAELVALLTIEYKIKNRILSGSEYSRWLDWKTRRRGGIFASMEATWPSDDFIALVEQKRKDY